MGWPNLKISETTRRRLAKAAAGLNVVGIFMCLIILITGAYISAAIQSKSHLIQDFDPNALPIFMIVVAFIGTFISACGIKICWSNHKPKNRADLNLFLLIYVIGVAFLFVCVFVSAIVCYVAIGLLADGFSSGISSSMKRYQSVQSKKAEIDQLQIEYRCCGDKAYTDWFKVSWIHIDYLSETKKKYVLLKFRFHNVLIIYQIIKI